MTYVVAYPSFEDIQGIQDLIYPEYFDESIYSDMEYSAENTRTQIAGWLEENINVIIRFDDKIIAFGSMAIFNSFYKDLEADVEMFFISKPHRGTKCARTLVEALVFNAKFNNAKTIYTGSLSGSSEKNDKLFFNLWKKAGLEKLGTVMIGKLNG